MAEEKKKSKLAPKTLLKMILGLIFIILGILATVAWWSNLLIVITGCIGIFAILAGAITIAIAKE